MHYTTSCNTQSSAPEDGRSNCPKDVELTGIINNPLLLHLVGCLYYLYQWCTVKQIWDNEIYLWLTCTLLLQEGQTDQAWAPFRSNALSEIGEFWIERYFHVVLSGHFVGNFGTGKVYLPWWWWWWWWWWWGKGGGDGMINVSFSLHPLLLLFLRFSTLWP